MVSIFSLRRGLESSRPPALPALLWITAHASGLDRTLVAHNFPRSARRKWFWHRRFGHEGSCRRPSGCPEQRCNRLQGISVLSARRGAHGLAAKDRKDRRRSQMPPWRAVLRRGRRRQAPRARRVVLRSTASGDECSRGPIRLLAGRRGRIARIRAAYAAAFLRLASRRAPTRSAWAAMAAGS